MAFTLRKPSDRGSIGLDIDGRYVAAAELQGNRVVRAVSRELPQGVVRDGEVSDPDALADVLKRLASESQLPRRVRLGVTNQQIVVRVIELPPIEDEKQRDSAVRFQAAETIAMPLDEAVLDYQVAGYGQSQDGRTQMQVVVVAARRKMIDTLMESVKRAGMKVDGIDLDAFALVRALAPNDAGSEDSARVYCHLAGVTNLAVAVGSNCFFTRPLSAVWDEFEAVTRLADEIRLSIDYYMTQPQAKPVGQVVLSGPGSGDEQLVADLGVHLGLPVEVAQPLGTLDGTGLDDDPRRYTVATGLALGAAA